MPLPVKILPCADSMVGRRKSVITLSQKTCLIFMHICHADLAVCKNRVAFTDLGIGTSNHFYVIFLYEFREYTITLLTNSLRAGGFLCFKTTAHLTVTGANG